MITALPAPHWQALYLPLLSSLDEEKLKLVAAAGRIRRGFYLPPGTEPERIAHEQDVWTYAVLAAAARRFGAVVPEKGMQWMRANEECYRSFQLAVGNPPTGVIGDIFGRAWKEAPDAGLPSVAKSPGAAFLDWVHRMSVGYEHNTPGAPLHGLPDGVLLVYPKLFKLYDDQRKEETFQALIADGVHIGPEMRKFDAGAGVTVRGVVVPSSLVFRRGVAINESLAEVIDGDASASPAPDKQRKKKRTPDSDGGAVADAAPAASLDETIGAAFIEKVRNAIAEGAITAGSRVSPILLVKDGALLVWPKLFAELEEDAQRALSGLLALNMHIGGGVSEPMRRFHFRGRAGSGVAGIVVPVDLLFPDGTPESSVELDEEGEQ